MTAPILPCVNPQHDHTEPADPDDTNARLVPMRCHHCTLPSHYDYGIEDYRHDDPDAPGCFLKPDNDPPGSECIPA